jgi:hypothetical protein
LGERHVEALAQVGDAGLRLLVFFLRRIERFFQSGELAPQRCDLLVEDLDLRQRPRTQALLGIELTTELRDFPLSVRRPAADAFV